MKNGLSARALACIEEFDRRHPLKFEVVTENTGEESEKSLKNEVRQIMLDKLKEMAKVKFGDCGYVNICNTMNDIAKTLLEK